MQALQFSEAEGLRLVRVPLPAPAPHEALVRVLRAGVCSTDLEILKGYVPGYSSTLGHEFVGVVERCAANPALEGRRVVGEINCRRAGEGGQQKRENLPSRAPRDCPSAACFPSACPSSRPRLTHRDLLHAPRCPAVGFTHPDAVRVRNHAGGRSVLGIIGKDGTMAQYCTLPAANLFPVPEALTDSEACFTEPLAAACRIVEQKVGVRRVCCWAAFFLFGGSRYMHVATLWVKLLGRVSVARVLLVKCRIACRPAPPRRPRRCCCRAGGWR